MSGEPTKSGKPAWLKWPAIFALGLIWAVSASVSFILGKTGKGANGVALWAAGHIRKINETGEVG